MFRTVTYRIHKIKRTGHFTCTCGNKYTKVKSSEWTESQAWRGRETELDAKCRAEADKLLHGSQCPKCGAANDATRVT